MRNDSTVRHFADNIGFSLCQSICTLKTLSKDQVTTTLANPLTSTTTPPPASSTSLHTPQERSENPRSTLEQPHVLPLVLASFTLHNGSASQEKSDVVIPITVSSQNGHTLCSALPDTDSPVTLLSEKLQCQLNPPAAPLDSHYHLVGTTGDSLTTLETAQIDIVLD